MDLEAVGESEKERKKKKEELYHNKYKNTLWLSNVPAKYGVWNP